MAENIYEQYYNKQVGSGIASYSGSRYQNGNGKLFGKILKFLKPAWKYISRQGLTATSNITKNLANGQNFSKALSNQMLDTGSSILTDGAAKLNELKTQQGKGVKRKRKTKKTGAKKKTRKNSKKGTKKLYKRRNKNKSKTLNTYL
jgi:hypothetical protein